MSPLAVLNAIIFGSAAAITFGLSGVVIIFLALRSEHPQFVSEFGGLLRSAVIFAVLTGSSGVSLLGVLKGRHWRWIAQTAMWFTLAGVCVFYWPR
jgi:hypothetical protein